MYIKGGELGFRLLGGVCEFLSLSLDVELFLPLLCHFAWFATFRAICWL
jgi:hypothetical protein